LEIGQPILVLYWFEEVDRDTLVVERPSDGRRAGVFSLRAPMRPNPIAAAILPVEQIDGNRVRVKGMDCLDGTPLLDVKQAKRTL
jgi:tRNA (Thr-GGU) A37 N-methylase